MDPTAPRIPVLLSKRLRLRAPRLDDFAQSYAMWSDPLVTRFIGGKPSTKEDAWARLLRYIGHWQAIGYGYWVVEMIDTGSFVGEVGFGDYRRDIVPSLDGIPEIGWVLATHAHGRGLASEAAAAALAWRDRTLPPGPTVCIIDHEHARSIRVAEKLGFARSNDGLYRGDPTVVMRRDTPTPPR